MRDRDYVTYFAGLIGGMIGFVVLVVGLFLILMQPSEDIRPRKPVNVPAGHKLVEIDQDGYYWIEPLNLGEWNGCHTCHPGRWNQGSAKTCTLRLEFVKYPELTFHPDGKQFQE